MIATTIHNSDQIIYKPARENNDTTKLLIKVCARVKPRAEIPNVASNVICIYIYIYIYKPSQLPPSQPPLGQMEAQIQMKMVIEITMNIKIHIGRAVKFSSQLLP